MNLTSELLRGFFSSQQEPGDSTLTIPQILVPALEVPSPFGPILSLSTAAPYPQNQVESQSALFSFNATRNNIAGASFRVAGLEQGIWDVQVNLYLQYFSAIAAANGKSLGMQISFDQLTFVGFGNIAPSGLGDGAAAFQTFRRRLSLQKRMFLNVAVASAGAAETFVCEVDVFANRLQ